MKSIGPLTLLVALSCQTLAAEAPLPEKIDYNRDVRPILSENCFKCHGFDEKTRDGGRRLDTQEGALAELESVRAIVPGQLEASDLHVRIHSTDHDAAMPPAKSGKKLTEEQKTVLDRWIEQGAPYARHWSFEPIRQEPPPSLTGHPIDAFLRDRLLKEGLAPSAEADPYTIARRLYLDLLGRIPSPEEADRFVEEARGGMQAAVEQLADGLLASPQYGERWARRWLDLARYADTNGYEKDRPRSIWPWRDWVIDALNADMPFDQFTIEQLAGDMLPGATPQQIIATGFHRNTMLNEEGGIDPLEFRYLAVVDRVATTGTTWMGLTVGCAQCHTHKYDPILHREYFQLMAFLNNADEPTLEIRREGFSERAAKVAVETAKLTAALPTKFKPASTTGGEAGARAAVSPEEQKAALDTAYASWLARESAAAVRWVPLRPASATSNLPLLTVQDDLSIFASGDQTKSDTYDLVFQQPPRGITAIRIEALPDERLPNRGPGRTFYEGPAGDFTMTNLSAEADGAPHKFSAAAHSFASGKFTASAAIDDNLQSGWSINGGQGQAHAAVFKFAEPLGQVDALKITMLFARHYASNLGRFRISVTDDTRAEFVASAAPIEIEQTLLVPEEQRTAEQRQALYAHFLLVTPELAEARAEITKLRKSLEANDTTLVLQERPPENPRPTFLHKRGEYMQPGERVEAGVPSVLPPLPTGTRADRLGLARWLVAPENPLTARVTVNRHWAILFGRGIVETTEDFGLQGASPTHPELLDWLAAAFMRSPSAASEGQPGLGWSVKKLHRLIVTSATYRQSAIVSPSLLSRDPQNVLLARGPRGRLEAEQVRDSTLFAAGLLSTKMHGPSVYPPQPEGVSEVAYGTPKWNASTGEDRYRRSLYTFAKRTAPFAMASTFDAPTGEACLARRETSNNPLQALTLLNDVAFVEAAQALGKSIVALPGTDEERMNTLFRRVLTRPPSPAEVSRLQLFFERQRARFKEDLESAQKVAGGEKDGLPERAAWTATSRALFNLDEAITRS